jgi:hypothetical protein
MIISATIWMDLKNIILIQKCRQKNESRGYTLGFHFHAVPEWSCSSLMMGIRKSLSGSQAGGRASWVPPGKGAPGNLPG